MLSFWDVMKVTILGELEEASTIVAVCILVKRKKHYFEEFEDC